MATKVELEKKIITLKAEIRELRTEAKTGAEDSGLDQTAYGVYLEDDTFHMISIKHDGKSAKIDSSKSLGRHLIAANSQMQNLVADLLIALNKKR